MRAISGAMREALDDSVVRPAVFVEAEFRTGTLRLWSGQGKTTWKGQEWNGPTGAQGGAVLAIEPLEEISGVEASGLKATLSGLDADILGKCLDEIRIGKKARLWFGLTDEAGAPLEEPYEAFTGRMDASETEEDGGTSTIRVTAENELLRRLQIPVLRRLTAEDQKIDFPNDTAFRHMDGVQNWKGHWGQKAVISTGVSSGGGGYRPPVRLR